MLIIALSTLVTKHTLQGHMQAMYTLVTATNFGNRDDNNVIIANNVCLNKLELRLSSLSKVDTFRKHNEENEAKNWKTVIEH